MQKLSKVTSAGGHRFDVRLGPRQCLSTMSPNFAAWPDQVVANPSAVQPYEFFVTVDNRSHRLSGTSLSALTATPCLEPNAPGQPKAFPFDYTGIGGIIDHDGHRYAIFHSEDRDNSYPKLPGGVPGFQASVGAAEWNQQTSRFGNPQCVVDLPRIPVGQVQGAPDDFYAAQGAGDPGAAAIGDFVFALFTDYQHRFQLNADHVSLGSQISLARVQVDELMQPASWRCRDSHGDFVQGNPSPVIDGLQKFGDPVDCIHPCLFWCEPWDVAFCIFCVNDASELPRLGAPHQRPNRSGVYLAACSDMTNLAPWSWSAASQLLTAFVIPWSCCEIVVHPSIVLVSVAGNVLTGRLICGYSPCYSDYRPHVLWGQEIEIRRVPPLI